MIENGIFKLAYGVRDIVRNIFSSRATKSNQGTPGTPSFYIQKFFGGGEETWSGADVTEETALQYAAYWSCLKVIRETIASLPVILYKRIGEGKEKATDKGAYNVLHIQPNPEQTAFDFKDMLAGHYGSFGNAYAEKVVDSNGQLKELWPLLPWNMAVHSINGKKMYLYRVSDDVERVFFRDEIIHIPNYSITGLKGVRPIDFIRQAVGMGLASEEFGARFFSNDATPGGIIEMPGHIKKEGIKRFKKSWDDGGTGANRHRTRILEDGAKFHEVMITPDKAQFLETRKFQNRQMNTFTRVPPHLTGDLENATFTNIEQQSLEFIIYTMMPHFVRWEQNFTIQALTKSEQKNHFFEFLVDALLRGDIEARYRAYRTGREIGVLSINDVLKKENMNTIPEGDIRHVPMNWVEVGAKPEPAPPASGDPDKEEDDPDGADNGKEDDKGDGEENSAKSDKELRTIRSAASRHNIAISYRSIHLDIMDRIQKREIADVKRGVKKFLMERSKEDFDKWFKNYYDGLGEYMKSRLLPVYNSISDAVFGEISKEIDSIDREDERREFVSEYIDNYIKKYTMKKKRDIGLAVNDSLNNDIDIDERMNDMYGIWDENLKNKSHDETVQSSNAFAKNIYLLAGIQFLRWVNTGGSTCPFCSQLDGKIVGIDQEFVSDGGAVDTPGGTMNVKRSVGHGPLHDGCDCQIMAG